MQLVVEGRSACWSAQDGLTRRVSSGLPGSGKEGLQDGWVFWVAWRRKEQRSLRLSDACRNQRINKVSASLCVSDGALIVMDCLDVCAPDTETMLRQALQQERFFLEKRKK